MRRFLLATARLGLMILLVVSASAHDQQVEVKMIDGIKVVHNLKVPADKAFGNLIWREDLVIGGDTEVEDYIFVLPTEIIADAGGNIYVLDYRDCTVKKYDSQGKFIARIGRKGQGPGEFVSPISICLDEEGRLLVGDWAGKIVFFDTQGVHLKNMKTERLIRSKMAPGGKLVFEYDETVGEGNQIRRIRRVAVEETNKTRLVLYNRAQLLFGVIQNKDFRLDIPLYLRWDINSEGRLYVGTVNRYEIQAMTLDGRISFVFTKDYNPLPVPSEIQSSALKQLAASRLPSTTVNPRDFIDYLKYYPIFKSITADEKGRAWIEIFQLESKDRSKATTIFDVFSPEGFFLFSTFIEAEFAARPFFKNGYLYALRRDAKGYVQAVRYRLPDGL